MSQGRKDEHHHGILNGLEEPDVSKTLLSTEQQSGIGSLQPGGYQALTAQLLHQICQRSGSQLQVQERATRQIAEHVMHAVGCAGVVAVVHAHHLCMAGRGAQQPNATTATIASLGVLARFPTLRCLAIRQLKH